MTLRSVLEKEFFPFVVRPARYEGNEWGSQSYHTQNSTYSPSAQEPLRKIALVVPDKYDRAMSLPELQLCYNFFRKRSQFQCERAFAPDLDAERILREKDLPLFSLETQTPLKEFDLLIVLLPHELTFTTVITILQTSQIPLRARDRGDEFPSIVAVPVGELNVGAISEYFDDVIDYDVLGYLSALVADNEATKKRNNDSRWESMLVAHQFSHPPVIPYEDVVQDRLLIKIPREYDPPKMAGEITTQVETTGYEEFSLDGDVLKFGEEFKQLCRSISFRLLTSGVRSLLPPLPPNLLALEHFEKLAFGRKKSLRFFIGAGSEFLREGLGLFFDINRFFEMLANAYARGWRSLRLQFYIGMPEENDSDLQEIVEIIEACEELGFEYGEKHSVQVTLTPFIPRPFTKWQWDEIHAPQEYSRRIEWVKQRVKRRSVQFRNPVVEMTVLEGLLARGGKKLAPAVEFAQKNGARFDSWQEHFSYDIWMNALSENGIDIKELSRRLDFTEELDTCGASYGRSAAQLRQERENAFPSRRRSETQRGFTLGDIVLSRPEVAEQILTPKSEEKRSFGRKPKRVAQTGPMIVPRSRIRLQWRKEKEVRHVGHLACMKMFERAIRRARIPVEYTQGQQPRQKVSLGPPLALGYTSDAEYFDLHLETPYQEEFLTRLNRELPKGFAAVQAKPVFGKVSSVSSQINMACYEIELESVSGVSAREVEEILSRDSITITRTRGDESKDVEIRPAIIGMRLRNGDAGRALLDMELGLGNLGFVRPDEILTHCFGLPEEKVLTLIIHRRALLVLQGERRLSPFEVS